MIFGGFLLANLGRSFTIHRSLLNVCMIGIFLGSVKPCLAETTIPPLFPANNTEVRRFRPLFSGALNRTRGQKLISSDARELHDKILCAFQANGIKQGPTNAWSRAVYAADHLSAVLSRMDPEWHDIATQHMLAQAVAETGKLHWISELKSRFASSWDFFKGRGFMMTTHKTNYAKLAGCADRIENNPPPQLITREEIARAPMLYNSRLVRNPGGTMSEATEEGRQLNSLSLVCYMIDNAERHPRLEAALKSADVSCIREVGVAVNRGPGDLGEGAKPYADRERIEAFQNMQKCFTPPVPSPPCRTRKQERSFQGVGV